ncbi:Tyrosine recombinase XerC [Pseudoalteromonas sp. P1-13-1a]|uniref:tyrosine-type recombinase/integrase n=1 Tax=Pseudoalteromonas sp. P1-13-1a TaxID=1723756 RepID=UPI0006D68EEA|nr:tyrosine-type recombinase/integrase [Pseudoalteromonas sp. P1-13-1a]KPZ56720.1 Tyrosine recombinase XerC [Pseudoalteromonas sp. P1-13-1a]
MRFKIVEGEQIDLKESEAVMSLPKHDRPNEEVTVTGVAVFNSKHQVLPHVSNWLSEALRHGKTPLTTISTYAKNLSYLFDYLNEQSTFKYQELDNAILDIQEYNFNEYFAYLSQIKRLASTTISNRDATFQSFFNDYLCKARNNGKALRDDNPYDNGLIYGSSKSKLVEMCSLDELAALMMCTNHEREKVLLQFMYDTGLRRSEIPRVKKEHIDTALSTDKQMYILDAQTIVIPSEYKQVFVAGSKGKKRQINERYTLTSIHTLARLRRYFSTPEYRIRAKKFGLDAPAFLNSHGAPYNSGSVSKFLSRVSERALRNGLIKRAIHPHMLRHGFAGSVLRSPDLGDHAVDKLVLLQICLGHAYLKTTQIYTQLPYETYGKIAGNNGEILTRSHLMEQLNAQTKTKRK